MPWRLNDQEKNDPDLDVAANARDRRWYRRQNRFMLALAVTAGVITIGSGFIVDNRSADRTTDRDEATKYQRCAQSADLIISTNKNRRDTLEIGRRNLRLYRALGVLVEESVAGTEAMRDELQNASEALSRSIIKQEKTSSLNKQIKPPDCSVLYPRGYQVSIKIGGVIPTLPESSVTTPSGKKQ